MIAQAGQNQERMGAAIDMVNTMNEVVADFQSLGFENNTNYKDYLSEEVWSAKLLAFAFFL